MKQIFSTCVFPTAEGAQVAANIVQPAVVIRVFPKTVVIRVFPDIV